MQLNEYKGMVFFRNRVVYNYKKILISGKMLEIKI